MSQDDTVQRAFELAESGNCRNVEEISRRLSKEGYSNVQGHLSGPTIRRQLVAAIKKGAR